MKKFHQIKTLIAGLMLSSSVIPVVTADDTEVYTTLGGSNAISNPNIMFVIDTSSSMETETWVKPLYDDSAIYPVAAVGGCDATVIYFDGDGNIPDCLTSTDYFSQSDLVCDHALVGYNADGTVISPGQDGSLLMIGTYSDQFARFDGTSNRWREVSNSASGTIVECLSDSGIHGGNAGKHWITDSVQEYTSTPPADPDVPHSVWTGGAGHLQLFSGNYLNYQTWQPDPDTSAGELESISYLEQVKAAVEIMVRGNTQVDIGLIRFDRFSDSGTAGDSEGGPVMYPILDVGANRSDFFKRLDALEHDGYTPLSEAYYEALLYYGGKAVDYGGTSNPSNQVNTTYSGASGTFYTSPISSSCDKNYIVLLSDGEPTKDDLNATRKGVLGGFNVGSCSTNITPDDAEDDNRDATNSAGSTVDNCLDELSGWAATHDVAVDSTIAEHDGEQHIITHTISFNLVDADALQLMQDTATEGGGTPYFATDQSSLIKIFNKIIANTLKVNTSFSSPAVSVNAFNRSTHLNDLYFTLFKPTDGNHWEGNLKKYKLKFAVDTTDKDGDGDVTEELPFVAGQDDLDAIDDVTGFFSDAAWSFWSASVDGKEVSEGGAVSRLTTTRNVYTFAGTYAANTTGVHQPSNGTLTDASNAVDPTNASLTDALLNTTSETTAGEEIVAGTPFRETLINWASGLDALSQFGSVNTYTDVRPQMGDPLHAEPALVQYGEVPGVPDPVADLVAYVATNDGYLHAFDVDDGTELFSFIPQELLPSLKTSMEDAGGKKLYGLDGNVVAWINDANGDGFISGAGEHVYLYFGMRRGGNNIYALDVTDRNNPGLLWVIKGGTGGYTELGQTWSSVNVEKIKDGATEKTVLVFGGGYDIGQDGSTVRTTDSVGRSVYIADALTGVRLWTAGADSASPTENMDYSIPARITTLDISGDGYTDRLYAADMGGQIFRFDINNTNGSPLSNSITGGRIADIAGAAAADARRFYYPPDVALIDAPEGKYHGLVITSGFRAHPLSVDIHDRIYMIKDRNTRLTSTYTTLTEADLFDVTANLAGGDGADDASRKAELANIAGEEGWYIDLEDEDNPGTWIGEKGLSEALILEGVAIVTTYTPNNNAPTNSCEPNLGIGKVFFLDMLDGTPAFPADTDLRPQRHMKLARTGIPPGASPIICKDCEPTICVGTECKAADLGLGIRKTFWYEVEK